MADWTTYILSLHVSRDGLIPAVVVRGRVISPKHTPCTLALYNDKKTLMSITSLAAPQYVETWHIAITPQSSTLATVSLKFDGNKAPPYELHLNPGANVTAGIEFHGRQPADLVEITDCHRAFKGVPGS